MYTATRHKLNTIEACSFSNELMLQTQAQCKQQLGAAETGNSNCSAHSLNMRLMVPPKSCLEAHKA